LGPLGPFKRGHQTYIGYSHWQLVLVLIGDLCFVSPIELWAQFGVGMLRRWDHSKESPIHLLNVSELWWQFRVWPLRPWDHSKESHIIILSVSELWV
jgi:hypothetical protein